MSKREVSVKSLSNRYETGHTDEISIDAIKRSGPGSKGRLTLQKKKGRVLHGWRISVRLNYIRWSAFSTTRKKKKTRYNNEEFDPGSG